MLNRFQNSELEGCPNDKKENSTMKKPKKIPKFQSEDEEREFWSKNDSTQYLDWKKAEQVSFPNLKATSRTISIRLPETLIAELKVLANKEDVPYQSMLKILLAEKARERFANKSRKNSAVSNESAS